MTEIEGLIERLEKAEKAQRAQIEAAETKTDIMYHLGRAHGLNDSRTMLAAASPPPPGQQ